jgi:H+-transporting ATPase
MIWAAVSTKLAATLLCAYGFGLVWGYSIVWSFVTDAAKMSVYRRFDRTASRHRSFLRTLGVRLHSHTTR